MLIKIRSNMRKISFILIATLSMVFVACDSNKKATEAETSTTPAVETVAEEEASESSTEEVKTVGEILKEYEATANKITEALLGMQKGDVKAIKEYQKLSPEYARLSSILSEKVNEMTPKEAKKFKEIAERITKSTPGAK